MSARRIAFRIPKALGDANDGTLIVVADAIIVWVVIVLFIGAHMYAARTSAWALALRGAGLAVMAVGIVVCFAELRRRHAGKEFAPTFGRGLMIAGAVGFAGLLAGFAWGMNLYCVVGVDHVAPDQLRAVPPFGMVAALLPVGACLALGKRGRVAVYVGCVALASVGIAVYLRYFHYFNPTDLSFASDERDVLDVGTALTACAVWLAPRLSALAVGLVAAWWMEAAARREARAEGGVAASCAAPVRLRWDGMAVCLVCGCVAAYVLFDSASMLIGYLPSKSFDLYLWFALLLAAEVLPIALGLLAVAGKVWPGFLAVAVAAYTAFSTFFFGGQDDAWFVAVIEAACMLGSLGMLFAGWERPARETLRSYALLFGCAFLLSAAGQIVFHSPYRDALEAIEPSLRAPLAVVLAVVGIVCLACVAWDAVRKRRN